jgi:hypothetical protein
MLVTVLGLILITVLMIKPSTVTSISTMKKINQYLNVTPQVAKVAVKLKKFMPAVH